MNKFKERTIYIRVNPHNHCKTCIFCYPESITDVYGKKHDFCNHFISYSGEEICKQAIIPESKLLLILTPTEKNYTGILPLTVFSSSKQCYSRDYEFKCTYYSIFRDTCDLFKVQNVNDLIALRCKECIDAENLLEELLKIE